MGGEDLIVLETGAATIRLGASNLTNLDGHVLLRVVPLPADLDVHRAVRAAVEAVVDGRHRGGVEARLVGRTGHNARQVLRDDEI